MPAADMPHRRLGRSGLKVSVLSFGSWVSFGAQLDTGRARDCMAAAVGRRHDLLRQRRGLRRRRVGTDHGPGHRPAGKALYWGTSEWSADEIRAAWSIADRHHLHKPVTEQPQYNLLDRRKVEKEFARLYEERTKR